MKYYPDISHWKPVKDWATVKKNCPFLITKATQGTSYVDPTLKSFIRKCEEWGIPYWLYTFLNRGNEKAQAEFMVKTCKPLVGKYFRGYVLDVEQRNPASGVKAALDYIKSLGGKSILYTMWSQYSLYKSIIAGRGSNVAWWEARYGVNNGQYNAGSPCHSGVDLHQYTSKGYCPGIGDTIDLNRLTGTLKETWFTGAATKPAAKPAAKPTKKGYTGAFPTLPARGFYQQGDGSRTLKTAGAQIKRIQQFLNWAIGAKLVVDGKYGAKTTAAVKQFQKATKLTVDGDFGPKTLAKAKAFKK